MSNPTGKGGFQERPHHIYKKGRPKSFDALRAMAQSIANEVATVDGKPVIIDAHTATNAEMLMRKMMHDNPERFIEVAFGKVPQPVELSGKNGKPLNWKDFINGGNDTDTGADSK